jgi:hypothetical protein
MGSHEKVCLGRVCGNASPGFLPMADVITEVCSPRLAVLLPLGPSFDAALASTGHACLAHRSCITEDYRQHFFASDL